jgi:ATP-dependent RNA helicase DeaD
VADLRARQLDITSASLRERLLAGKDDQTRVVVESLAQEFDIVDIAAAAVAMAHAAVAGDGEDKEIPQVIVGAGRAGTAGKAGGALRLRSGQAGADSGPRLVKRERGRGRAEARTADGASEGGGPMIRLFLGAGRKAGIRPGDLVGAITGEAGVTSRSVGAIEVADNFSLVEVPESLADGIIAALRATMIRGKKVNVRRERER